MALLPIDVTRVKTLAGSDAATEVYVYNKDRDAPKVQEVSEDGRLMWAMSAILLVPGDNAETIRVKLPAKTAPEFAQLSEIRFTNLTARAYKNQRTDQVQVNYSAEGVTAAGAPAAQRSGREG